MRLIEHEKPMIRPVADSRHGGSVTLILTALLILGSAVPASAQQGEGDRLFQQRCGACHSLGVGKSKAAPNLQGVVGRKAGATDGFRYSDGMKNSDVVWDTKTLDAFLAAPRQVIPGTSMSVAVPNAAQRAAIIALLEAAN